MLKLILIMIQRVQTLFLFLSAISSILIIYYAPVFSFDDAKIMLSDNYQYSRVTLLLSAGLSLYTIIFFKNRSRQILLSSFSRLLITISLVILLFQIDNGFSVDYGVYLMSIPYLSLFLATYFIKKDEKLVRSADRIR